MDPKKRDRTVPDWYAGPAAPDSGIPDGSINFAKLVNISSSRILGRISLGLGVIQQLTGTEVTALLDVFTTVLKGLVPSGGSASTYLRGNATWATPNSNISNSTGLDGACVFDGSTTVLGLAPSASVYTLTRDIFPSSMTVNNGVVIKTANYRIFVAGTLTNNGTIQCNGNAASGGTGGAAVAAGFFGASGAGGNGASAGTGGGGGSSTAMPTLPGFTSKSTAIGGGIGSAGLVGDAIGRGGGSGGDGSHTGASGGATTVIPQSNAGDFDLSMLRRGRSSYAGSTAVSGGSGGGGGPGSGGSLGGGGGGGAGYVWVEARAVGGAGAFTSIGGAGASGAGTTSAGGGGGGGWIVVVLCGVATGTWTTSASGGTGGSGGSSGFAGGNGADGIVICPVVP